MSHSNLVTLLLLLVLILQTSNAVDRSKFKRCDQSNFCKRNRNLASQGVQTNFQLISKDLKKSSDSKISGSIQSPFTDNLLNFELIGVENNILRMRIFEKDPKRYMGPQDLLLSYQESKISEISKSNEKYVFKLENSQNLDVRGELTYNPFKLDIFVNNELAISSNKKNLLNFEHLRNKENDDVLMDIVDPNAQRPETWDDSQDGAWEAPKIRNPESDGRWDESFGGHQDTKPRGPTSIGLDFTFHDSQHVYGIPEHATSFALKPTRGSDNTIISDPYRLYNLDVFEYELNNEMALYGSVPYMISHSAKRTNGILWFNSAETWIDVTQGSTGMILGQPFVDSHWISESGIIDVFFFLGPKPQNLFSQYAAVTGTTPVPPLFSVAYHQCKWNYKDQREVAEVDSGFDSSNIPYDVIWLDIEHTDGKKYFTWDHIHFSDPVKMQIEIAAKGRKMVTIIDPHIKRDSDYYIHKAAQYAGDLYIKKHDGGEYEGHCWPGSSSWIDYVNPKARQWWADKFSFESYQYSTPNLFTWNDMNEPSVFSGPEVTMHKDALHYGELEHRDVHNAYGLYLHAATSQGLVQRNPSKNERPFVLSRAFFAGSQRYGAIWTGDNAGKWDHLAIAQPMLLSLGVAGITFSGADVGGFFGNPEVELLTRWYQAGAFHPFFRGHGHLDSKRREPFLHPEPYQSVMRDAIRTRYSFLPFWYSVFYEHSQTGAPVMRPLWAEYPTETSIFAEENSFLVGKDLLVKPVTSSKQESVSVYFPGTHPWFDFVDNVRYEGGSTATIATPLEKIPVFQRGGSIVPKKERVRRSSTQMSDDPYTLVVALNNQGAAEGTLYVDDYHSFNYQNGDYLTTKFTFANQKLTNTVTGGKYRPNNTVERVVVFGLSKTPSKVTLEVGGRKVELQSIFENGKLTIRKPDSRITEDWVISLL